MNVKSILYPVIFSPLLFFTFHAEAKDNINNFNINLLYGNKAFNKVYIDNFLQGKVLSNGYHRLNIFLNGGFIKNENVYIKNGRYFFNKDFILNFLSINKSYLDKFEKKQLISLNMIDGEISAYFKASNLSLNISIPQGLLKKNPVGYLNPRLWSHGVNAGFINYDLSYLKSSNQKSYFNLLSNAGINIDNWHYRWLMSVNNNKIDINNIVVRRNILPLKAVLSFGDVNTTDILDNVNSLYGVKLSSALSMIPYSLSTYGPVISGIAKNNAIINISQDGYTLLRKAIHAGQYLFNDIIPPYSGSIKVTLTYDNGEISSYKIPYVKNMTSLRKGIGEYSIVAGVKDKTGVFSAKYKYGLNNFLTESSSVLISKNYFNYGLASNVNSFLGGFSGGVLFSNYRSKVSNINNNGNTWFLSYTNSLPYFHQASFKFISYLHSSRNYLDFNRYLNSDFSIKNKNSYNVILSFPLEGNNLSIDYSRNSFWDYNSTYNIGINYSGLVYNNISYNFMLNKTNNGTNIGLNFSIPFGNKNNYYYNTSINSNNNNLFVTNNVSAQYKNINVSVSSITSKGNNSLSSSINYNNSKFSLYSGLSKNKNSYSYNASLSGAIVYYNHNIIFSPQVSNTFGIYSTNNTPNVKISNEMYSISNNHGYGIITSLNPYLENGLSIYGSSVLNTLSNYKSVIPYNGSIPLIKFNISHGHMVSINIISNKDTIIPFLTPVYTKENKVIGYFSQNNNSLINLNSIKDDVLYFYLDKKKIDINISMMKKTNNGYFITKEV